MKSKVSLALLSSALLSAALTAQPDSAALGAMPPAEQFPKIEFVFEERVTLAPAIVLGDAPAGRRQYIPITGGTIAGPRLNGRVIPGGWDYQNRMASGCFSMTADYFLEADDGTVIHILNESFNCASGPGAPRSFFRPRFEAPIGSAYEWMNSGTFVATLEADRGSNGQANAEGERAEPAIRIKVYQIK